MSWPQIDAVVVTPDFRNSPVSAPGAHPRALWWLQVRRLTLPSGVGARCRRRPLLQDYDRAGFTGCLTAIDPDTELSDVFLR